MVSAALQKQRHHGLPELTLILSIQTVAGVKVWVTPVEQTS